MAATDVIHDGEIYEITHVARHNSFNMQIVNRYFVRATTTGLGGVGTATRQLVLDSYETNWLNVVMPELSSQYRLIHTTLYGPITAVTLVSGPPRRARLTFLEGYATPDDPIGSLGGKAGAALPAYCTVSVQCKTGYLGRFWRGGKHMGPIARSDVSATNDQVLDGIAVAAWETALDFLKNPIALGTTFDTAPVGVYSGIYTVITTGAGISDGFRPYTDFVVSPYLRSQLSRKAPHVP